MMQIILIKFTFFIAIQILFADFAQSMTCFQVNGLLGCDEMTGIKMEEAVPEECRKELKICTTFRVDEIGNAESRPYQTDGCVRELWSDKVYYNKQFRRGNVNRHCEESIQNGFNVSFCCCQQTNGCDNDDAE